MTTYSPELKLSLPGEYKSVAGKTSIAMPLARRNFLFVRGKNGIEPMSYLELLLVDSYKGNTDDLPWLGSTKDGIARMQSEKAEREKPKEEHSS